MHKADREPRAVLVGILLDGAEFRGKDGSSADGQAKDGPEGLTVVEVGIFHEFGFGVPKRSFIRDGFDESERALKTLGRRLAVGVVDAKITKRTWLLAMGSKARSSFIRRINKGIAPGLSEVTIARKGSSRALIDTGQLKGSITYSLRGGLV
jgi:hypothetical protein